MTSLTDLKGFYFQAIDRNLNPRELKVIVTVSTLVSLINVEVGINVEGGIFWKILVHNSNKRGVVGGKI